MYRRNLLILYGALVVAGFGLGRVSWAAADKPTTPQKKIVEKVLDAIERIAEESGDAGPGKTAGRAIGPGFAPSAEPENPDGGLPEYRRLPEADAEGGGEEAVVIVDVEDVIDMGLSAFIERTIDDNQDAAALILDINTPGGRVDAATEIRDAIMNAPKTMRTVAFIHPRAISAGAFISFACDLIFIADGGSMGAATPITISGGGAEPVDEKMVSYFRTEMATTARAKGRRGDIAEAMVDYEIEIKGLTPAGKLLTLDTAGALKWKVADAKANSLDEVLEKLALGKAKRRHLAPNWAEEVVRILTHPILSGILMSVGMLGILIELYQPGFGLPGIVGLSCLILFFAGHLLVNLAGWEEVLLFLIGIVLIGVEVFVTPGFGVIGGLGVLSIVIGLVMSITAFPIDVSFSTGQLGGAVLRVFFSVAASLGLFAVAVALLPRSKLFMRSPLVLQAAITGTAAGGREGAIVEEVLASGKGGVAESFLRPAGIARFGNRRVDVVSEGDFIEKGEKVAIVRVEGNRVIVKKDGGTA